MIICPYCRRPLADNSRFCNACGGQIVPQPQPTVQYQQYTQTPPQYAQQPQYTQAPPQYQPYAQQQYTQAPPQQQYAPVQTMTYVQPQNTVSDQEVAEFVENTRRLLRWEAKAWKISGMVLTIIASVYSALFLLGGLISWDLEPYMGPIYVVYAIYFLILLLPFGIVGLKSAGKIPYYLAAIQANDFAPVVKRCSSVGMLVLSVIFGVVSPVFFIINFVRMKANKHIIERLIGRQQ